MTLVFVGEILVPLAAVLVLAVGTWAGVRWSERVVSAVVVGGGVTAIAAAALGCALVAWRGPTDGWPSSWVGIPRHAGEPGFPVDTFATTFALVAALLIVAVAVFSRRYLHRDPGFTRFHLLLALFLVGVECVASAGSLATLVVGWELTGLASALLIAFFHLRAGPVDGGLRALITYRACDIGLLCALVWSARHAPAVAVGLFLVWAAMGKGAQFPIGGWLPRAMEGPTPSSAVFYGAVSVALGPFLLLRTEPLWSGSVTVRGVIVLIGVLTACHATVTGRVLADVKSVLAYASMTQIGVIMIEVGLGLRYLALIHLIAHSCLRAAQILRSPSLLHDHDHWERTLRTPITPAGPRLVPSGLRTRLYRFGLERGHTDTWLVDWAVGGLTRGLRSLSRVDDRVVELINGGTRAGRSV